MRRSCNSWVLSILFGKHHHYGCLCRIPSLDTIDTSKLLWCDCSAVGSQEKYKWLFAANRLSRSNVKWSTWFIETISNWLKLTKYHLADLRSPWFMMRLFERDIFIQKQCCHLLWTPAGDLSKCCRSNHLRSYLDVCIQKWTEAISLVCQHGLGVCTFD